MLHCTYPERNWRLDIVRHLPCAKPIRSNRVSDTLYWTSTSCSTINSAFCTNIMPDENARQFVRMRSVQRDSISEDFRISDSDLLPEVPRHGARIKVRYLITRLHEQVSVCSSVKQFASYDYHPQPGLLCWCLLHGCTSQQKRSQSVAQARDLRHIAISRYGRYVYVMHFEKFKKWFLGQMTLCMK